MGAVPGRGPIATIFCPICGRENAVGRLSCWNCNRPLPASPSNPPHVLGPDGSSLEPEQVDPLQVSLQEAQTENQKLRQQIELMQLEVSKSKAATPAPEHSPSVLATLHDKLKTAEESVATWASHATGLESKWKAAEGKVALLETQLASKVKQFEELLKGSTVPKLKSRFMAISAIVGIVGSLGGLGVGRYLLSPDDSAKVKQLSTELAGAQQRIQQAKSSLDYAISKAAKDQSDLEAQIRSAAEHEEQLRSERENAITAQHLAESKLAQAQAATASLNKRVKQRDDEVTGLRAALAPRGTLTWSGNLGSKGTIDITNGVASYGTVDGALPRKPCRISTQDRRVKIKTRPSQRNHWDEVAFDVSSTGFVQVRIDWELVQ